MTELDQTLEKAKKLQCYEGPFKPVHLSRGITNTNFIISDGWISHVLRYYSQTIRQDRFRKIGELDTIIKNADNLKKEVSAIDLVYGQNDLLTANFIDEWKRL